MRIVPLILGGAAIVAAARIARNRARASQELAPAPPAPVRPTPAATPDPAAPAPAPATRHEPAVGAAGRDERTRDEPPRDEPTREEPTVEAAGPDPDAPRSAVSPAAATVQETQDDLMAGLREERPDPDIEREVEQQIAASPLPSDEVSVEVKDHVAQLEGTVPDPQTAFLIGDEAAHVDGVRGLDNRLVPERTPHEADDETTEGARPDETPRDAEAARDPDEARREAG